MKKLQSTLPNMILSLGIITAIAGALLGVVYAATKEPIAKMQKEQQVNAIRQVAPPFDNDPEADIWITKVDGIDFTIYPAFKDGKLQGAAVMGSSMNGFSGEVKVMCGFDLDGTVRNYEVLSQAETPGLGAKMQTWFRDPTGARSVIGKNPAKTPFYVTQDKASGGQIDAITAATISSRAFLEILRRAYDSYTEYAKTKGVAVAQASDSTGDAYSGASQQWDGTKATEGEGK